MDLNSPKKDLEIDCPNHLTKTSTCSPDPIGYFPYECPESSGQKTCGDFN